MSNPIVDTIQVRVQRSSRNRDGYILRDIDNGKIGFIQSRQIALVEAGQLWEAVITSTTDEYFKAFLKERIRKPLLHLPPEVQGRRATDKNRTN